MTTNVLIAGVGGQGVLLVSEILSEVCLQVGYDVKKSEVHGMAQRGGSVTSHVRFGEQVHSPLIERGTADILLAFEWLEAARWAAFLGPDGKAIVNDQQIAPIPVSSGVMTYPEDLSDRVEAQAGGLQVVDGIGIAREIGDLRVTNIVLLGALSSHLDLEVDLWTECIARRVPPKTVEMNLKAFERGWNAGS